MKKSLPQKNGFTLIELLVVIAIIAVLAVMGLAVFSGLTGRGNDDRRRVDLKAFADAMEVKKANNSYQAIVAADFASGTFPKEPTNRAEKYCYKDGTNPISNTTIAEWASLTNGCPSGWANIDGVAPTVSANASYFKVCTVNEAKLVNSDVICFGSRQ